jgi:Dehydrogenase E1 component/2-oxoisovalerate dehydrogenase E1 alpha subunit N terminal
VADHGAEGRHAAGIRGLSKAADRFRKLRLNASWNFRQTLFEGKTVAMNDTPPLQFHVPEPAVRPGDAPDFSNVRLAEAGSVRRPEIDADPESMRDLAYSIIRVLNRDGEAVGSWAGSLTEEELAEGLRHMMTLRAFDARMQTAQRQGKTSFYMQHMGEEAVSCAFRQALEPGDMNFPTYRQAGLLIAGGYPMVEMMNQIYSNERDPLKGRQLPVMYSSKEHGFFSISGNLGTQFVQAVGWAMASAIKRDTRIASASGSPRCASTATTISPCIRSRNGRSRAPAAISVRHSSNMSPIGWAPIRPRTIRPPTGRRWSRPLGRSAIP